MTNQEKFLKILEKYNWELNKYEVDIQHPPLNSDSISIHWWGYGYKLTVSKDGEILLEENCRSTSWLTFFQNQEDQIDKNNPVYKKYAEIVKSLREKNRLIAEAKVLDLISQ